MLEVNHVYKNYTKLSILQDIDFKLDKGSILGLAGPSGSGKSTLLRCIQKLEKIDNGEITYDGSASFMFQDFQLFPHMTVLSNIVYAPKVSLKNPNCDHDAMQLLEKLGLKDKSNYYPSQLSGGQKQRVALARCLMMKPDILLFDEPTSGLDVATIDDVVQLLTSVNELGVTMIIASHDLDFLSRIARRILVLKSGMIVADINVCDYTDPINHLKYFYQESV